MRVSSYTSIYVGKSVHHKIESAFPLLCILFIIELFQESFPDINLIRNVEGGHRKVEIDYSDVAEVSGRGISVGSVDQWFGVSRKFLSSAPLTWSARYGPVITVGGHKFLL